MDKAQEKIQEAIAEIEGAEVKVEEKAGALKRALMLIGEALAMLNPFDGDGDVKAD